MARALNSVIVTTDNIEAVKAFYVDGLKLLVAEDWSPDAATTGKLWGLPGAMPIRELVLKRRLSDERGVIRLVEIKGAGGRPIREGAENWDYGIFDYAFAVIDNEGKTQDMQRFGYGLHAWPVRYDFAYYPDRDPYYVTEGVINGPNDTKVVFMERFNAPHQYGVIDESVGFSEVVHSAQVVEDMEAATRFYSELLGLPVRGAFKDMEGAQFEHILKISRTERFDMSLLADPQLTGYSVELIYLRNRKGKNIAAQASMLNYGIAALSFETEDLDVVLGRMLQAKREIVAQPMNLRLAGVGNVRAFSVRGPAEVLCEVYQRI